MKIHFSHTFPCTTAQYWKSFDDEALNAELRTLSEIEAETLERRKEGDIEICRQQIRSLTDLPRAVAKVFGSPRLEYIQETREDRGAGVIHWTIEPPVLANKITAAGRYEIVETAHGTERVMHGEISVRVPLIGGQVEKAIAAQLQKSYDKGAALRVDWIKKNA